MAVTGIRALCASRRHERDQQWATDRYRSLKDDVVVVVVETDDGVTGVGEAAATDPRRVAEQVRRLGAGPVGRDLFDRSAVPRPSGSVTAHDHAAAGIDCALWDARSRHAGLPVRLLLGGTSDVEVPVVARAGANYDWSGRPESLIDDVRAAAAERPPVVTVRLGTAWTWDGVTPARFLALYDQVRAAVGPGLALAVDACGRLRRDEALEVGAGLALRGAAWLAEPLPRHDLEGHAWLGAQIEGLRLAGGGSWTTAEQFRPFLDAGCYDVVTPDAGVCGISEVLRIGALAARHGVEIVPGGGSDVALRGGGLMLAANAHAAAALPNASMVGGCARTWGISTGGARLHDGRIVLDGPGLGVDIAPDLEHRFPFVEGHHGAVVYR